MVLNFYDLNTVKEVKFTTSQKSVRDRYKLLLEKHNKKMRMQIGESGSVAVETELDNLLSNIKEEAETFQEEIDKATQELHAKKIADNKNAEEIRERHGRIKTSNLIFFI